MTIVQPRLTYADLQELPEDGKRYELLEGELVVSPAPTLKHQKVTGRTYAFLLRAEDGGYGEAYVAPVYAVFDDEEVTEPDVIFIRRERLGIVTASEVRGAPDLVVEVLSPSTRRRDLKGEDADLRPIRGTVLLGRRPGRRDGAALRAHAAGVRGPGVAERR
jgi:Uma2 family endonuclease